MLKSLIQNDIKQCTQLVLHICGSQLQAENTVFNHNWLKMQMQNPGIQRADCILLEKTHLSGPVQFKPVLFKGQLYMQLLPLPFEPCTGKLPRKALAKSLGLGRAHDSVGLTMSWFITEFHLLSSKALLEV